MGTIEQLTIDVRHLNAGPQQQSRPESACDNSTWHAINTRHTIFTKEISIVVNACLPVVVIDLSKPDHPPKGENDRFTFTQISSQCFIVFFLYIYNYLCPRVYKQAKE